MQSCIPCLIFTNGECKLDLRGGTNADHAPPIDYYEHVCFQNYFDNIRFEMEFSGFCFYKDIYTNYRKIWS